MADSSIINCFSCSFEQSFNLNLSTIQANKIIRVKLVQKRSNNLLPFHMWAERINWLLICKSGWYAVTILCSSLFGIASDKIFAQSKNWPLHNCINSIKFTAFSTCPYHPRTFENNTKSSTNLTTFRISYRTETVLWLACSTVNRGAGV